MRVRLYEVIDADSGKINYLLTDSAGVRAKWLKIRHTMLPIPADTNRFLDGNFKTMKRYYPDDTFTHMHTGTVEECLDMVKLLNILN